jgi:hypothetical protein
VRVKERVKVRVKERVYSGKITNMPSMRVHSHIHIPFGCSLRGLLDHNPLSFGAFLDPVDHTKIVSIHVIKYNVSI